MFNTNADFSGSSSPIIPFNYNTSITGVDKMKFIEQLAAGLYTNPNIKSSGMNFSEFVKQVAIYSIAPHLIIVGIRLRIKKAIDELLVLKYIKWIDNPY